jgi:tellurite resistance-related uncharacterized protein
MQRTITGFHRDADGEWVAELECGHGQHVRHAPPWQLRPWVESAAGRADKIGSQLDCRACEMGTLPVDLETYRRTPTFDETSIPRGLLSDHRTKPGVWASIVVESGKLEYLTDQGGFVLSPDLPGIVRPERPHRVRPIGPVRFHVVFHRSRTTE